MQNQINLGLALGLQTLSNEEDQLGAENLYYLDLLTLL